MRMRWRGLELPTKVTLDEEISTDSYGLLTIEPFERGFGITVGNSLRRILLSSLEGSAVTSIKIGGVDHEFSSIPGVVEDVTDIVLNVKTLIVSLDADVPKTMKVTSSKAGVITAGDIEADTGITIINPDQVLATLSENKKFTMEMTVACGRGYVPANENPDAESYEMGVIPIDSLYSPVVRVRYKTEETRVGQSINYERLIMEIWTDSTVSSEMALVESAKILRKHLGPFIQYFEMGEDVAPEQLDDEEEDAECIDEEFQRKLSIPIQELGLGVRAVNCLESAEIDTVKKLVSMDESKLLTLRSFGKTSMRQIKHKLADLGLKLGGDKSNIAEVQSADQE